MKLIKHISIVCFILAQGISSAQAVSEAEAMNKDYNNSMHETLRVSDDNKGIPAAEASDSKITLKDSPTIIYTLYVSQNIGISNYKSHKNAENNYFEVGRMKFSDVKAEHEFFKNEKCRVIIFKKGILNTKQKEAFNFDGLDLNITAEITTQNKDVLGRSIMETVLSTIKSNNVVINVI